jgi:hypothetical protein
MRRQRREVPAYLIVAIGSHGGANSLAGGSAFGYSPNVGKQCPPILGHSGTSVCPTARQTQGGLTIRENVQSAMMATCLSFRPSFTRVPWWPLRSAAALRDPAALRLSKRRSNVLAFAGMHLTRAATAARADWVYRHYRDEKTRGWCVLESEARRVHGGTTGD